jgi:4-hydroxy-tetrahydrodipicolinate synthase
MHAEDWDQGVIAGSVTPFDDALHVDLPALIAHLHYLADGGSNAVVVNADTGEGAHLDESERGRVLNVAVREIGNRVTVLTGLVATFTREAMEAARRAEDGGARALQVFPPPAFLGHPLDPGVAAGYYEAIAEATSLPLIVYRPPLALGFGFDRQVLARLATIQAVAAIKESSFDRQAYAETVDLLGSLRRRVKLLSGADTFVLDSLRLGADGAMLAIAAVAPERWVELFELERAGRKDEAERVASDLQAFVDAVFAPPFRDFRARLKEALVSIHVLERAQVRPPLLPLREDERRHLVEVMER